MEKCSGLTIRSGSHHEYIDRIQQDRYWLNLLLNGNKIQLYNDTRNFIHDLIITKDIAAPDIDCFEEINRIFKSQFNVIKGKLTSEQLAEYLAKIGYLYDSDSHQYYDLRYFFTTKPINEEVKTTLKNLLLTELFTGNLNTKVLGYYLKQIEG